MTKKRSKAKSAYQLAKANVSAAHKRAEQLVKDLAHADKEIGKYQRILEREWRKRAVSKKK